MRHKRRGGFQGAPCFPACALSNLSTSLTAQRVFLQDLRLKITLWSHSMKRWAPVEDFSSAGTNQYGVLYRDTFPSSLCFCGHNHPRLWNAADTGSILLNIWVSLILLPSRYSTKHNSLSRETEADFYLVWMHQGACSFGPGSELRNTWACLGLSDRCCWRDQPGNWGWITWYSSCLDA